MAKVDTWMPIYWGDYAKDTGHLGAEHHGAYLMLIKHYWTHAEPLPNDDAQLWRIATVNSLARWRKIKDVILAFFELRDGRLHHGRIDDELAKAEGNADRRTEMARRAAEARWSKEKGADAPRMPAACSPPSPTPADNPHGKTIAVAVSASASPDGPPRPRLPESAKWAERLDSYRPWLPHTDPLRGRWQATWGLPPDSAGKNISIPDELLAAWRAKYAAEIDKLRSAA